MRSLVQHHTSMQSPVADACFLLAGSSAGLLCGGVYGCGWSGVSVGFRGQQPRKMARRWLYSLLFHVLHVELGKLKHEI